MLGGWCSDCGRFVPHFLIGERSLPLTHPSSGGSACPTLRRCARWRSSGRTGLRSCGSWWTCSSLPPTRRNPFWPRIYLSALRRRPPSAASWSRGRSVRIRPHGTCHLLRTVGCSTRAFSRREPSRGCSGSRGGSARGWGWLPFVLPGGDDDVVGNADDEVQPTSDILFTPKHLNSTTTKNSRMLAKLWLRLISNFILMRNSFRGPENNHGQYVDICFVIQEAQKATQMFFACGTDQFKLFCDQNRYPNHKMIIGCWLPKSPLKKVKIHIFLLIWPRLTKNLSKKKIT